MANTKVILIIAAPGDLQAGLQLLLSNAENAETLVVADERSAMGATERHSPSLVILDSHVAGDKSQEVIRQIKRRWPDIRCLALHYQSHERDVLSAAGADAVLPLGYPAARLKCVIETLLSTGSKSDR